MPPTKTSVKYRTGSTSGSNNCSRCINYLNKVSQCDLLEVKVKRDNTCQLFVQDPEWRSPYE